jgi:hypothetical protein
MVPPRGSALVEQAEEVLAVPGLEELVAPLLEGLDLETALLEVVLVHVGDLVLAPGRGLEVAGDLDLVVVVEVDAGNGVVAARPGRLFLERDRLYVLVEFDDAVRLGIGDVIGEDRSTVDVAETFELAAESGAVEDVVAGLWSRRSAPGGPGTSSTWTAATR